VAVTQFSWWEGSTVAGAGKLPGVRKVFTGISPNLPEKFAGNSLCISSHTDDFWDDLHSEVFT